MTPVYYMSEPFLNATLIMSSASKIPGKITAAEIKQAFRDRLRSGLGRLERFATRNDLYLALALTVRDRLFERIVETIDTYGGVNARRVAYLSAEYLPGPHLANNLLNLGLTDVMREALRELGYDLEELMIGLAFRRIDVLLH